LEHRDKSRPATIRDVARRAGVSTATVSHVLNHSKPVRRDTAARVERAIQELGYQTNTSAKSLASGRSAIVGLVVSDIENPFFPEVTRAFQEAAHLQGQETIVMSTHYDPVRTLDCIRRLVALQVAGVAVLTSEMHQSAMDYLARKGIRAVYLDVGKGGPHTANIAVDYTSGIRQAVEHLRQLGHQRIAFISGPPELVSLRIRREAFLRTAAACSIEPAVIDSDLTIRGGYWACGRALSRFHPTAVMAANDLMAIGALHAAYDHHLRVPEDLSVAGFDNILFSEYTQPTLTTVAIPRRELGEMAFQALWDLLAREHIEGSNYCLATRLVVRESTGPAPRQGQPHTKAARPARAAPGISADPAEP
jgi:DNA-binding LacI/PurR family transcriptional regulator